VVFNDGLQARLEARAAGLPYLTDAELSARLTAAKATPDRAWLGEVSAAVLQQALADLNAAYRNFFASVKGTRKGPKVGPPRFRSRKDHRQAIRFTRNARFSVTLAGKLRLPKIGDIPVRWSRRLPSAPSSVAVIMDSAGRYFASFVVETDPDVLPAVEPMIGIDLGLAHFVVLSDGRKVASPRFLRQAESRLKRRQRDLSRKQKGSRNRDKARVKVARTHLAKSVHDAGWSAFVHMLEYKARRYGREFIRIGRFEPTSRVCSACGARDGPKPLYIRTWQCQSCGAWLDRDVNAAVNVARAAGLAVSACGVQVRPGVIPAQRGEAGTHLKPRRETA
jgi:putative transposase